MWKEPAKLSNLDIPLWWLSKMDVWTGLHSIG